MSKKQYKVALYIDASRAFCRDLLLGIVRYCHLHGSWIFFRESVLFQSSISNLKSWSPDGIIVHTEDEKKLEQLAELNLPTIALSGIAEEKYPHFYCIAGDNIQIGKVAADYFIDRGFKNFGYVSNRVLNDTLWSERGKCFSRAVEAAGYKVNFFNTLKKIDEYTWAIEQKDMMEWLKSLPKPCAVMAFNDDRAQLVLEACKLAGVLVPEEVAVLGVDNDEIACGLTSPPLSSIVLNAKNVGYELAELLQKLMSRKNVPDHKIICKPVNVITRQSTDVMAVNDSEIAKALNFIRANSHKAIYVDDVVNAVTISRRVLEKRFSVEMGRSINHIIRAARIEQVAKMLTHTDKSITDISTALGYHDSKNLARYFYLEKKMTPAEYRRKFSHA